MTSFVAQCEGKVTVQTAPNDPRFPLTNQTRACYVWYNEYYKCVAEKGAGDAECDKLKHRTKAICPDEWIAKWDEMRENGTWYGRY